MATRKYVSSESLGTSNTTVTTDTVKVTATFTPDANSAYVYIWSCDVSSNSTAQNIIIKLKNNSGSTLSETNWLPRATTNIVTLSGIAFESFGSSPTSQSITLNFALAATGVTGSIKNARIIAIQLDSSDVYVENTSDQSTTANTLQTATTLTFTPATTGDYLIIGSCEYLCSNVTSSGSWINMQLTHNSISYNTAAGSPNSTTDYISGMMQAKLTSLPASSQTVTMNYSSAANGTTVRMRRSRILALRLDKFETSYVGNDNTDTSSTSTPYVTKYSSPANLTNNECLVICTAVANRSGGTSGPVFYHRFVIDELVPNALVQTNRSTTTGALPQSLFGSFAVVKAINRTTGSFQYATSDSGQAVYADYVTISYLSLVPHNKARRYHYAESLGTSTSSVTTDTTKVTLIFTPDASSTYVYLWNCEIAGSSTSYDTKVSLNNNAGTVLCASNWETKDITADWSTLSGMAFETFSASPTSQSITLRFSSEIATSHIASIRNARIIAIKLTSEDIYTENTTDQTTTLATQVNALTLTVNPSTSGSYLVLGSCEARTSATGTGIITQIAYAPDGSVDKTYSTATSGVTDTNNYNSFLMQAAVGTISASRSIRLQFYSGTAGTTVNCRRARLLALRLDEFSIADINGTNSDNPDSTTTASTSYVTKKTSTATIIPEVSYLVIGSAAISGGSTTFSVGHGINVGGEYIVDSFREASIGTTLAPGMLTGFTVKTPTTSSITVSLAYYAELATLPAGMSYPTISVLMLDPTDLYWVNGSGTWNSSNNSNWALSSGGTGGAAAPKGGTNIYFDVNSDVGGAFTVTVNTGAICKSLTASNLSYTMTLSGSAAMSVYGSFSVPATNFTQSYTGTITFAGSGAQTITTNGKSFTAGIFNGGSSWTLQDALTFTGAVTFNTGTINLSSYTLTCSTFTYTNLSSIPKYLNFDTGKIVITSSSTTTVWNTSTDTDLVVSGSKLVQLTGGGATTKTISAGTAYDFNFQLSCTAGTVAFTASNQINDLTIDNNNFTLSNVVITIDGNLTIAGTTPTLTAGANAWTFAGTTGTQIITTNGKTLDFPITFSGTGTYALGSALSVGTTTSRAVTFTSGTLELSSYTLTIYGAFSSSGSTTRRIQMSGTGGKIVLTVNTAATIWNTSTSTNLTTDGNILVQVLGGGPSVTRTISTSTTIAEENTVSFQLSCTDGTIAFTTSNRVKNLTIDNTTFTLTNVVISIYGNLSIGGTTPTLTAGTNAWTLAATSGTKTITTSGKTLDFPITFSGTASTIWQLQDALTVGNIGGTARTTTLLGGTIDINSLTLTTASFVATGSTAKVLAHGTNGDLVVTGSSTSFNASGATNLTSTGTGLINMTSTSTKTFAGNGNSFNTLSQTGTGLQAPLSISGSNTFKNITNGTSGTNTTFLFAAGTTQTFTEGFSISGTAGNLVTIGSTTTSPFTLTKTFYGNVIVQYCNISYSTVDASGWFAPFHNGSNNNGNNTNWIFTRTGTPVSMFL